MEQLFKREYLILIFIWVFWCTLHSFMISTSITNFLKSRLGSLYRFYRLLFNAVSIITIIPVLVYSYSVKSEILFRWEGLYIIFQAIIVVISFYFFYSGAKYYDGLQFLGIRQIKEDNLHKLLSQSGQLDTKGILCVTRHPWYLGSILIIWVRDLSHKTIVENLILVIYLIVGTILEERKLIAEFGDQYREYQKRVSMLFPFKWIIARIGLK